MTLNEEGQHPGQRKAAQNDIHTIMSSMCMALDSFIAAPAAPDEGNAAVLGDPSVIHEVGTFLKEVRGTSSQDIVPDTFDKFVCQLEGILDQNPAPHVAESIRSILIMVARPMGVMLFSNADTVPPSITTLINHHYGCVDSEESNHESSAQQLDMPLWFVGKMTANEAEQMLRDKVNGSFMVRDSDTKPGTHNITVRHADLIYHFRIKQEAGEMYLKSAHRFTAMSDLVRWLSTPQEIGGYTVQLVFPAFAYASNPWYAGSISKAEAETMLLLKPVGAYQVRRSLRASSGLTLTLRVDSAVVHYCIAMYDDGMFGLNREVTFKTVDKLIAFYARRPIGTNSTPAASGSAVPRLRRQVCRLSGVTVDDHGKALAECKPQAGCDSKSCPRPVKVEATTAVGDGFGKAGFYQRRWMTEARKNPKNPDKKLAEPDLDVPSGPWARPWSIELAKFPTLDSYDIIVPNPLV